MALAALLILGVLLSGSELGRLSTPVRALGALVGGVLVVSLLWQGRRLADATEKLVVGALVLFLLTCLESRDPRASFDAATTALAYAAAFLLARRGTATETGRRLAITVMGSLGVVLGLTYALIWGAIWLRWMSVPGAGLPPLDLRLPGLLYGHQYPVAMLLAVLLPAVLALSRRKGIRTLAYVGALAIGFVVFASGGRAIWLAGATSVVVAGWLTGRMRLPFRRKRPRFIAIAGASALLAVLAYALWPRLATTGTIELRFTMWSTAISHWLESTIVGFGPGNFAREFAMTGYYGTIDQNAPHAHNLVVQTLFEGGIVGLLGLCLLVAAQALGVRGRRTHWSSSAAIAFFLVVSLADNPAVVPSIVLVLVAWCAIANPRTVRSAERTGSAIRWLRLAAASVLGIATVATLMAAQMFDRARDAALGSDAPPVIEALTLATRLDPGFALYHRELGVWLFATGNAAVAERELREAVHLNPSDPAAQRSLALILASRRSFAEATDVAAEVANRYATRAENPLTLAYVSELASDRPAILAALVSAVRLSPWLTAAPEWAAAFPDVEVSGVLAGANESWRREIQTTDRTLLARSWLAGLMEHEPIDDAPPALRAQAAMLSCDLREAQKLLTEDVGNQLTQIESLRAQLLLQQLGGHPPIEETEVLIRLHDPGIAWSIETHVHGVPLTRDDFYDNRYYNRVAMPVSPGPILPSASSGMSAWLRDPAKAADVGAPQSMLAKCM